MFYSTEVLRNRRSSLGIVWSAAFGRRLARSRILNLNINETCDQLMDPDVPQALRLQAILTSGIVKVHEKKVTYLKEDAEHAMKHLCEVESRNNRSIDLEENVAKSKRITMKRKLEELQENPVDLFFGSWESLQGDFNFGGSYGDRDEDYFVISNDDEHGEQSGMPESLDYGLHGDYEQNYIMDSPDAAFIPQSYDLIRPDDIHIDQNNDYFDMSSPVSVMDNGQDIIVVERKRKRRLKVDEAIVDQESFHVSGFKSRLERDRLFHPVASTTHEFASFHVQSMESNALLLACLKKMRATKVLTKKRKSIESPGDPEDVWIPEDGREVHDYYQQDVPLDIEIEKLRTALHTTPNQKAFGYISTSKSLPTSSAGLSEDSASLSNRSSVQKQRLSELFEASQYDLHKDGAFYPGSPDQPANLSQLDRFNLKETEHSQEFTGMKREWDKSSHTLDILTKARLCCSGRVAGGSSSALSLDDITSHLSRHEAATMFHHILVGVSNGFITAHQSAAYEPITIDFCF